MTPDIRVKIAGVEFANPVMTASGCSGSLIAVALWYGMSTGVCRPPVAAATRHGAGSSLRS